MRSTMTSMVSPGSNMNRAIGLDELRDRNQTFGFVAEVDDNFLVGDFQDIALENLTFSGRREVAVVVEHLRVVALSGKGLARQCSDRPHCWAYDESPVPVCKINGSLCELPAGKSSRLRVTNH